MFTINISRKASLDNIGVRYHSSINKIILWSRQACASLGCDFYGLYVRGSVALGCETKNSDLDIVVLLSNSSLSNVLTLKASLSALISLYTYSYPIGIKVFNTNSDGCAEPPTILPASLREKAIKSITFDIYANGVCFSGNKIRDASILYESYMEFREISQMIWGLEIQELVDHMNNNPLFGPSHCYVLIKKCIRLSAYVNFNNESIYYGSTEDCFRFSIIAHKAIKNELVFLYDYFKNRSVDWPNDIKKLRDPIETVSNYLLTI